MWARNTMLIAAREKSGKTQAQVAAAAQISTVAYQNYEYGKREPIASTANLIAEAVGSTVESLWGASG
jgi:DNA-binding helix-turn-helix protein